MTRTAHAHLVNVGHTLACIAVLCAAMATPAVAADRHVDRLGLDRPGCGSSDAPCRTLQFALDKGGAGDRLVVAAGAYVERISIERSVIVVGAGAGSTVIDADRQGAAFTIGSGLDVTLQDLTVTRGSGDNGAVRIGSSRVTLRAIELSENAGSLGGAVQNTGGDVVLEDCWLINNRALSGGAIYNSKSGTLRLVRTALDDNTATELGGGVFNEGRMEIASSDIRGGIAVRRGGGGIANRGDLTIAHSSIRDSQTTYSPTLGFGAETDGAGILNEGQLTLVSSVVANNTNRRGLGEPGAGGAGGGLWNSGHAVVRSSLIADNRTELGPGGGIYNAPNAMLRLSNSIVAGNRADWSEPAADLFGTILSDGYNLIEDPLGADLAALDASDLLQVDPRLGPPVYGSTPSFVLSLLPSSPAIDAANPDGCVDDKGSQLVVDILGQQRKVDGRCGGTGRCDIGPYEADCQPIAIYESEYATAVVDPANLVGMPLESPFTGATERGADLLFYQLEGGNAPGVIHLVRDRDRDDIVIHY